MHVLGVGGQRRRSGPAEYVDKPAVVLVSGVSNLLAVE